MGAVCGTHLSAVQNAGEMPKIFLLVHVVLRDFRHKVTVAI
jgi:hypothetical protein